MSEYSVVLSDGTHKYVIPVEVVGKYKLSEDECKKLNAAIAARGDVEGQNCFLGATGKLDFCVDGLLPDSSLDFRSSGGSDSGHTVAVINEGAP